MFMTVYAMDLPGFARSSRVNFSHDPIQCEEQFVQILEAWRREVGLNRMNLLGHSFGAYLCTVYALKYPQHIQHLILADPWGLVNIPNEIDSGTYIAPNGKKISKPLFKMIKTYGRFNPLGFFRLGGRALLGLINHMRKELIDPFNVLWENHADNVLGNYWEVANLNKPTGEEAYRTLSKYVFWAKYPLIERLNELDENITLTVVYGGKSWITRLTS